MRGKKKVGCYLDRERDCDLNDEDDDGRGDDGAGVVLVFVACSSSHPALHRRQTFLTIFLATSRSIHSRTL